ncbi:HAD family hydrolase [Actinokineospora sp.]|uniref:HAD family hydrolase n=1 Tax=Actinokineospora sp. TaxID=1872133 RepID=UPI00403804F8
MDIELVIFDCDGILVDSEPHAVRAQVIALTELGWAVTETEVIDRFVGKSTKSISELVDAELGPGTAERSKVRFYQLYHEAMQGLLAVDGIADALDAIDLPKCVASSGNPARIRDSLAQTGLAHHFGAHVFSAVEVPHGKPAPDLFLHAARGLGVAPGQCVVVEDSQYGVRAARAAGMRSFGYAGGVTPAAWLAGPDTVVFHDMRALPGLIRSATAPSPR